MTLREFDLFSKGVSERIDDREKHEWERTRWLALMMMLPNVQKGKSLQPKDLIEFPWEKKTKVEIEIDIEQQKKDAQKAFELYERLHKENAWKKVIDIADVTKQGVSEEPA